MLYGHSLPKLLGFQCHMSNRATCLKSDGEAVTHPACSIDIDIYPSLHNAIKEIAGAIFGSARSADPLPILFFFSFCVVRRLLIRIDIRAVPPLHRPLDVPFVPYSVRGRKFR